MKFLNILFILSLSFEMNFAQATDAGTDDPLKLTEAQRASCMSLKVADRIQECVERAIEENKKKEAAKEETASEPNVPPKSEVCVKDEYYGACRKAVDQAVTGFMEADRMGDPRASGHRKDSVVKACVTECSEQIELLQKNRACQGRVAAKLLPELEKMRENSCRYPTTTGDKLNTADSHKQSCFIQGKCSADFERAGPMGKEECVNLSVGPYCRSIGGFSTADNSTYYYKDDAGNHYTTHQGATANGEVTSSAVKKDTRICAPYCDDGPGTGVTTAEGSEKEIVPIPRPKPDNLVPEKVVQQPPVVKDPVVEQKPTVAKDSGRSTPDRSSDRRSDQQPFPQSQQPLSQQAGAQGSPILSSAMNTPPSQLNGSSETTSGGSGFSSGSRGSSEVASGSGSGGSSSAVVGGGSGGFFPSGSAPERRNENNTQAERTALPGLNGSSLGAAGMTNGVNVASVSPRDRSVTGIYKNETLLKGEQFYKAKGSMPIGANKKNQTQVICKPGQKCKTITRGSLQAANKKSVTGKCGGDPLCLFKLREEKRLKGFVEKELGSRKLASINGGGRGSQRYPPKGQAKPGEIWSGMEDILGHMLNSIHNHVVIDENGGLGW